MDELELNENQGTAQEVLNDPQTVQPEAATVEAAEATEAAAVETVAETERLQERGQNSEVVNAGPQAPEVVEAAPEAACEETAAPAEVPAAEAPMDAAVEAAEASASQETEAAETAAPQDAEIAEAPAQAEEAAAVEETAAAEEQFNAEAFTESLPQDKNQLVDTLSRLIEEKEENLHDKVDLIKQAFYKLLRAERAEAEPQPAEGETAEEETPAQDEAEGKLKQLLAQYKKYRSEQLLRLEQEREQNQKQKESIIERMKSLVESEGEVSEKMAEYKQLQQEWNQVGPVSPMVANDLWKNYNLYRELFYDQVKISNELRDYDFKKNLEIKNELITKAEALAEKADVVGAFRELQELHNKWKETGPVARELRDDIWDKFKAASTVINKKHQDFFTALHEKEEDNYQRKTALCEQLEQIDLTVINSTKKWDDHTQTVLDIQNQWRTIGFAPRKVNQQIYDRYRAACDRFFEAKAAYFQKTRQENEENLQKKTALCEQAEALKESTEWKSTTDKLMELQRQWKEIGPVARRHSEAVWARFRAACDEFFTRKKQVLGDRRDEEVANLKQKRQLIEQIDTLAEGDDAQARLHELIAQYNAVGHVPYSEKEKLYKRFRAAVDKQFDALHLEAEQRRIDRYRSNLEDLSKKGESKLQDERRRLQRVFDTLKQEIATSENNIGFFNAKSKGSNSLIEQMERKIESLKAELKTVADKIALIDEKTEEKE